MVSASYLIIAVAGFLIGSFPTGYLIASAHGVDVRSVGSHNIGATNVVRSVNPWAGRIVFVVDVIKGFAPTILAPVVFPKPDHLFLQITACMATILGHNYTPWLKFRGGKGIAAGIGGFLALCWPAQVIAGAIWLVVFFIWRYVSIASMAAAISLPALVYVFTYDWRLTSFGILIAIIAVGRHSDNIKRFREGSEYRFGGGREE
jgi:glycerol-3-phosphate acyltransferase PlsY